MTADATSITRWICLAALALSVGASLAGCAEPALYACSEDAQCVDGADQGRCELVGFCSFADAVCDSRRRFGALAPSPYAGACVELDTSCIVGIAAGARHTCAWKLDGSVWCWGDAESGQLGDGQTGGDAASALPVQVQSGDGQPLGGVSNVVAGASHTCARTNTERLVCWGDNALGQLGDRGASIGMVRPYAAPVLSATGELAAVAQPIAGAHHTCAATTANDVQCVGNNDRMQSGTYTMSAPVPELNTVARPPAGAEAQRGAAGSAHTCAVYGDRTVWCWGANSEGQLGVNDAMIFDSPNPLQVRDSGNQLVTNAGVIAAGDTHSCYVSTIGDVRCWGDGRSGQVGDGNATIVRAARRVYKAGQSPLAGAMAVGLGAQHSCAVAAEGRVYCWGANTDGQLGTPGANTIIAMPVQYEDGSDLVGFTQVDGGGAHTCALRDDGSIWCWGSNVRGRLGVGTTLLLTAPQRVALSCP